MPSLPISPGRKEPSRCLFADLRTFTGIAEQKLPYDLVFLLNSYFETVGESITGAGGTVDKFIGDGVMALFGIEVRAGGRLPASAGGGEAHGRSGQDAQPGARRANWPNRSRSASASTADRRWSDAWVMAPLFISRQSATRSTWPADFRI